MRKERLHSSGKNGIRPNGLSSPEVVDIIKKTKLSRRERKKIVHERELGELTNIQLSSLSEYLELRRTRESPHVVIEHRENKTPGKVSIKNDVRILASTDKIRVHDAGFMMGRPANSGVWPEQKEFITNGGLLEEHVSRHILPQLSEENRQAFLEYIENGGRIVYAYDRKVSERFKMLFQRFKEENHGGADTLSYLTASVESASVKKDKNSKDVHINSQSPDDPEEGKVTIERLLNEDSVRNAIHFFAISPDKTGQIPEKVKKAIKELNFHLLPTGFKSLIEILEFEKQKKDRNGAILISAIGAGIGVGMYAVSQMGAEKWFKEQFGEEDGVKWYKFVEQNFVSLVGEIAALEVNMAGSTDAGAGTRKRQWKKELAETIIEKNKQTNGENNTNEAEKKKKIFSIPEWVPDFIRKRLPRYPVILPGLSISALLSGLDASKGEISYFLAIAPTNRTLYTTVEIFNRTSGFKKQGVVADGGEKHKAVVDYFSSHDGWFHKKLTKLSYKHPALALGIKDFSNNSVGSFALLGTYLSFFIFKPATMIWPALAATGPGGYRQATYALSGIIFENGVGAAGGLWSTRKDPFERLEERLPVIRRLEMKKEIRLKQQADTNLVKDGEPDEGTVKRRTLQS